MVASSLLTPKKKKSFIIKASPPLVMALMYLLCIVAGAGLLMLPQASYTGTSFADALFTACSSVTVTGLMILDAGTHFTFFGQLIILGLITLGGLGLMAFAVLIMALLGIHSRIGRSLLLKDNINETNLLSLVKLVFEIFKFVLIVELIGTCLLAIHFVPAYGWAQGLWYSAFHTISAFNNAGISLFSTSLIFWGEDVLVNLTIPALIILGGIGYTVLADIHEKRRWRTLNLHSKLMLTGSAGLILWGMAFFAALEWHNPATLGYLSSDWARIMASWFQSVTTRTAGFNTINIGAVYDSTSFMMMPLMIIGGGGSSTAGGIKVTTFLLMLLAVVAFFKQREHLQAFGRSVTTESVLKAMAIITLSLLVVLWGIFVLTLTNNGIAFLDLAFEAAGAFSTAGISRGITSNLDSLGRIAIMALMLIGKLGPLAFSFFISTRSVSRVRYPSSEVFLG